LGATDDFAILKYMYLAKLIKIDRLAPFVSASEFSLKSNAMKP